MAESHWAQKEERGSFLGLRILLGCYRYGGHWLVRVFLLPVVLYFYLTEQASRKASQQFLQRVYAYAGDKSSLSSSPGWVKSLQHYWHFAQAALDKVDAWMGRNMRRKLQLGEVEAFEQHLSNSETGAVLIASHLGNIEVCRALVKQNFSRRMNVLVFTGHAEKFNRMLKAVNPDVDVDLIQATAIGPDLVIMLKSRVEQGECVVIVGDRVAVDSPEHVVWAQFLGHQAPFAIGPWVLASVLECPIFFISCLYHNKAYQLDIELFEDQFKIPRRNRQAQLEHAIQRYAFHLESVALQHPLQWYNFYNFWCLPNSTKSKNK